MPGGHRPGLLGQLKAILDESTLESPRVDRGRPSKSLEYHRQQSTDRSRRYRADRAAAGGMYLSFHLDANAAASMLYLLKQWKFNSRREATQVALLHLAKLTREGLENIEL